MSLEKEIDASRAYVVTRKALDVRKERREKRKIGDITKLVRRLTKHRALRGGLFMRYISKRLMRMKIGEGKTYSAKHAPAQYTSRTRTATSSHR